MKLIFQLLVGSIIGIYSIPIIIIAGFNSLWNWNWRALGETIDNLNKLIFIITGLK